jgi:hypothetical protein
MDASEWLGTEEVGFIFWTCWVLDCNGRSWLFAILMVIWFSIPWDGCGQFISDCLVQSLRTDAYVAYT